MNLSFLASFSHGPSDAWNHLPYSKLGCHCKGINICNFISSVLVWCLTCFICSANEKVMEHMGSWTTSSVHQRFDQ